MINRDDMLELTRRMTPKRTCFTRIAGAYMDRDGEIDNTFNVNFLNLTHKDKLANLAIAKAIPFSKTNEELTEHMFDRQHTGRGSMWQLLNGIHACGLKNDLLMEVLYEQIGKYYRPTGSYSIAVFHGTYDVPARASDGEVLEDSDEVYDFIIGAVCPLKGEYDMEAPDYGFLFPAFSDRCALPYGIDIYVKNPYRPQRELTDLLTGKV